MNPILMAGGLRKAPLTFAPAPDTFDVGSYGSALFTIRASEPVVWHWSSTGALPSSTVSNGGTDDQITFSLSNSGKGDVTSHITVTSGANTWQVDLSAWGTLHV